MPKKQTRQNLCPECETPVKDPYKTWELVAPFPDKKMRITVTIFGMYECPKCGKKFRAVVSKAKLGTESIEL
ncbi:MAG: chromatin protein Cren7 [Candidatus Bathyarchaeia archaeon]|nr:chromatin protein Cren7 [Candidatus Bathyarchaeia archaeon]